MAKQAAAAIRAALKAQGIGSREVSVRSSSYSMGSSVYVTVKSARVSLAAIERIANAHQRVRHCELTGEILSGGNTYVSVSRDSESAAEIIAPVRLEIGDLAVGESVDLTCGAYVRRDDAYEYAACGGPLASPVRAYGVDSIARQVAEANVDFSARPAELSERECAELLPVPGLAPVVSLAARRLAVAS